MLVLAAFLLFAGVGQMRAAKAKGTPLRWWKQLAPIQAICLGSFGGLYTLIGVRETVKGILVDGIAFMFALVVTVFSFYVLVLSLQQFNAQRAAKKAQKQPL